MPNVVYRKRLEPCHQSCQRLSDRYLVNENVKGRGCGWKGDEPGGIKTSNPRCTLVRLGSTLVDGTWSAKAGSRLRRESAEATRHGVGGRPASRRRDYSTKSRTRNSGNAALAPRRSGGGALARAFSGGTPDRSLHKTYHCRLFGA